MFGPVGCFAANTMLHPQDAFGIAVRDLLAVGVADRELLQELDAGAVRLERPIDREQDVIRSEREQRAQERRLVPVAAGSDEQFSSEFCSTMSWPSCSLRLRR